MPNIGSSAGNEAASDGGTRALGPGGPSVTWLGHASAVADLGTGRVVFDPLLPWRARAAGRVDAILITHSHVDHLNRWSLKAIDRDTHLVVPRGCKPIVADLGFAKVSEVTAGDQIEVGGLEIPERQVLPRETPVDATRDTVLLTRSPDRGSCVPAAVWLCSPRWARPGEDPETWRREFTVSAAGFHAFSSST